MQKKRPIVCLSALCTLLLGLMLLLGLFTHFGSAQAHVGQAATPQASSTASVASVGAGKLILVSLSKQWMYVYENGQEVFDTPVITGQPSLATPTGTYHIFSKQSPVTFISPWPKSSKYYYPPTKVQYGLEWRVGGFYIHDSWWHTVYGPGMNGWHKDPTYGWQWGSHGCISVPLNVAAYLYQWAPIGTTVEVVK